MLTRSVRLLLLAPALFAFALAPAAHANTISGLAYCGISSTDAGNTPAPGAPVSGTQCATFTVSDLAFYSNGSSSTNNLGSFLSSEGDLVSVTYLNGFSAASSLDKSFWQFTGTGYFVNGQTYTAVHDDGTVMNVNGTTVLSSPGGTSARSDTFVFNSTTGNYAFVYDYTEIGGVSEYGTNAAVSPVPEPSSILLFATGAGFLFFMVRQSASRAASREFLQ